MKNFLRHASLVVFFVLCTFSRALGAVVYVGQNFIVIDRGEEDGLKKDQEVCIDGDDGTKLGCGIIKALRAHLAGVLMPQELMATIAEKVTVNSHIEANDLGESLDQKKLTLETYQALFFHILFPGKSSFQYHFPRYDLAAEIAESGSVWKKDKTLMNDDGGFELGYAHSLTEYGSIATGIRWMRPSEDSLLVDYIRDDPESYINEKTIASSYGFFLLGRFTAPIKYLLFHSEFGLDIDRSKVEFSANQIKPDGSATIASLQSNLSVSSFRVGISGELRISSLGIYAGVIAKLPVAGQSQSSVNRLDLKSEVSQGQKNTASNDLQESLGHERAKNLLLTPQFGLNFRF